MARVTVEAGLPIELYEECKKAGINQWSSLLQSAIRAQLSISVTEKREQANEAQRIYFEDAIRTIQRVLLAESKNHPLKTNSFEFAQEYSRKLNAAGYLTNASELLKEAGQRIVTKK